jgi:hypothetical protein
VLSLARCRALLGPDCKLTEAQLEQRRQDLYALAEVALESFSLRKRDLANGPPRAKVRVFPIQQYETDERAAILEFEAGMDRSKAEDKANFGSVMHRSESTKPRPLRTIEKIPPACFT